MRGRETRERDGRKYWWVCDVGDKGIRRQLNLSFVRRPSGDTEMSLGDTTQVGEGGTVQTH